MPSDMQKFHLSTIGRYVFLVIIILAMGSFSIISLSIGLEGLLNAEPYHFGAIFTGGFCLFFAVWMVFELRKDIKWYLGLRSYKVPQVCVECNENLYRDDVKWIEKDTVECPHCGTSYKLESSF